MPEAFERLLTEAAPDAGPPWIACFRDELAAELLKNPAFERLLMASNLSDAAESGAAIRTLARSLQSKLHTMDATLVGVDTKVDRIALHQDEQLAHLRQLNALLFQSGSPPSPEMSSRVLTGAMFGASGQAISTALIFVQIFGTYSPVDALGRETRSSLIREAHARLAEAAGEAAYVGRIDGGEFDIIMRDVASSTDATLCCDRIAQAFLSPFDAGGTPILLRPKMGVAISPEHGFAPEALQRNADLALRSALAYGSKDIVVYVPELRTDARDRKQLEIDLRRAIEANELHLVFQPVIELAGRRLVGYEALVRWVHPSRGPISPSTFVPIAEEAGLIVAIGDWALRTACVHATQWPDDVRVAVNISPIQFANPAFPSVVMSALADTGLSADRLELEITEGVFLAEGQTTSETFAALKKVGTRLVLDDFGTGYSSLGYLKQAPLDKIKIDQSFVRRVSVAGGRDAAIIRSIVGLAKALGMETTAEGIETEDELLLVEQLGCTYGQGYFFGRPHQA
ncbi:MAG: EAL domain-containing protein [Sphingobium sp.]|nr:EAL domain-containing protein [Sphingobium sp.]